MTHTALKHPKTNLGPPLSKSIILRLRKKLSAKITQPYTKLMTTGHHSVTNLTIQSYTNHYPAAAARPAR